MIVDLAHLADVPSFDPRTWQPHGGRTSAEPLCIAVDILDEDHSLGLAMRRLATQPALRERLGHAATEYWRREHAPEHMVEDYLALIDRALHRTIPQPALPAHLLADGGRLLDEIACSVRRPTAPEEIVKIRLNGDPFEIASPLSISALLAHLNIDPRRVAVEHNLDIIKRARYDTTIINEGDEVEIVNFVGGG